MKALTLNIAQTRRTLTQIATLAFAAMTQLRHSGMKKKQIVTIKAVFLQMMLKLIKPETQISGFAEKIITELTDNSSEMKTNFSKL